jgi:hypothetical protein
MMLEMDLVQLLLWLVGGLEIILIVMTSKPKQVVTFHQDLDGY